MPFSFWMFIIFGLFTVGTLIAAFFISGREYETDVRDYDKGGYKSEAFGKSVFLIPIALGVLSVLFLVFASANQVPVRNVGIITSFSKPTDKTTGSGLKWVAPWHKIADWDASVQTSDHAAADKCTTVRIGSMATACVESKVRWKVKESAAPEQYMSYKGDFNNMKNNLFETELQNAMTDVFATYNPLSSIDLKTGQTKFDGTEHAKQLQAKLDTKIGNQIVIESVTVPLVHHDAKTEANIEQYQNVIAQGRILGQKQANAEIEKQTSELLKNLSENYSTNKCLDIAKELGKEPGLCMGGTTPIFNTNK